MNEKIEPALSDEEWAKLDSEEYRRAILGALCSRLRADGTGSILIAILNHDLPDSDPRKITRATVESVREAAFDVEYERGRGLIKNASEAKDELAIKMFSLADALESYLPPSGENGNG